MSLGKKQIIDKITNYISGRKEIEFAYIFGSFVDSDFYHDVDICIYLNKNYNYRDNNKFPFGYESLINGELSLLLKTDKIDVVILNKANPAISQRIVNKNILLFERGFLGRIEIENRIRKEYIANENLRKIKSYYLKQKLNA